MTVLSLAQAERVPVQLVEGRARGDVAGVVRTLGSVRFDPAAGRA